MLVWSTCDLECVWLVGVDVDLPWSRLSVSIEIDSAQVAHSLNGPQFSGGFTVALAHTCDHIISPVFFLLHPAQERLPSTFMVLPNVLHTAFRLPAGLVSVKLRDDPVM